VSGAQGFYERGRRGWPDLALTFEAFVAHAGQHLENLADLEPERVCAEDLFLVAACLARVPGAIERFDAHVWPQLERHLRRKEQGAELTELRQALLVRLFVNGPDGAPPRIAGYTGRGPLVVWLRMVAARLLADVHREQRPQQPLGDSYAERAASASPDVEISFIRGQYEQDFVAALRAAVASLGDEERMLLQFRYRQELNSDQIAVVLKTSRATAARRVAAARDLLAERLREGLRARLALSESGLEQLMGLLSSRLVPALTAELRSGLAGGGP
jgi:RNA polymerase sigma-70 factor (ECF subfamily)